MLEVLKGSPLSASGYAPEHLPNTWPSLILSDQKIKK